MRQPDRRHQHQSSDLHSAQSDREAGGLLHADHRHAGDGGDEPKGRCTRGDVDEIAEIARKPDGDRGRGDDEANDHRPAHDEGDPFRHRVPRVLVLAGGTRKHRTELRVAQPGERAQHSGDEERGPHERTGVRRRGAEEDVNAGADDDPYTARSDLHEPEGAVKRCRIGAGGSIRHQRTAGTGSREPSSGPAAMLRIRKRL